MTGRRARWFGALSAVALSLATTVAPAQQDEPTNEVVGGLSQHSVSLTTGFAGSELFVYGAVKGISSDTALDIVVTVTGPSGPVTVRRKERQFGIWISGQGVEIDAAPSFYVVASTKPFRDTVSFTDDLRYAIGLDQVIKLVDAPDWVEDREAYRAAVARIREADGLYAFLPNSVNMIENTLFETRIALPANLVEGDYRARIFLIRDKAVLDVFEDTIEVRRAGIGRWIYTAAQEYPAPYGVASILVALFAGWLASAFFRTFFPN
ncbi:MAG: TIGR02186 family protein [Pseudomonadota bacterium]